MYHFEKSNKYCRGSKQRPATLAKLIAKVSQAFMDLIYNDDKENVVDKR